MKRVNILSVKQAKGVLVELYLENGLTGGRLRCPQSMVPRPGQYLLAHDPESEALLPVPVFSAGVVPEGFLLAPPIPETWRPGVTLSLRGPLGRGFSRHESARWIALVALGETAARLKPLLEMGVGQGASVVLVSDLGLPDLLPEVEVQPVAVLPDVQKWADYMALDLPRESIPGLREMLGLGELVGHPTRGSVLPLVSEQGGPRKRGERRQAGEAQALVLTPMPCGALADCGVCAVNLQGGWKMACKEGPVFDLIQLI